MSGIYHILREASACLLVLLIRAIPGPQNVGRAAGTALTHFCFLTNLTPKRGVRRQPTIMKKTIRLCFNARLLCTNEKALKNVCALLTELEDKGYIENGKVVFDEMQENEVSEIFNRHLNPKTNTPIK